MLSAQEILALQDRYTRDWHGSDAPGQGACADSAGSPQTDGLAAADRLGEGEWLAAVARQHRANFDLWHIEDEARTPGATDAEIASVKRRIDRTNQLRNDLVEELDRMLLAWLQDRGLPRPDAPLNSESPGLIIDRLSILGLKSYHTREEVARADAPEGHAERNQQRLTVLEEQRADLAGCLNELWRETLAGSRRFKIYRQLKMYNDPTLNPAVYAKSSATRST
jgi:hypothetical protein